MSITYNQALTDWIDHCQATLDENELRSAKNFSRAFRIWYDRAMNPDSIAEGLVDSADWLWHAVDQFAWDFELEADPILERLNPESRTTRIAFNYRNFVGYLHDQKVLDDNDYEQSIKASKLLEDDLLRLQRTAWMLRQNDSLERRILDKLHPGATGDAFRDDGEDNTYEIVYIGENFILGDKCDEQGSPVSSPDNPTKIRLPATVLKYLKKGDTIDATFEKAQDGDYWSIQSFTGVDSGAEKFDENELTWTVKPRNQDDASEEGKPVSPTDDQPQEATYAEKAAAIRSTPEYQARKEELLKAAPPPPDPLFPEDLFTDKWFEEKEKDINSDDEDFGTTWLGGSDSEDDEERESDFTDESE